MIKDLAKKEATTCLNKDFALRYWAASHGGVYVPITESTPPNPFLNNLPERDIKTPSGNSLTLMNPAYMLRQTMNQYESLYGVRVLTEYRSKAFQAGNGSGQMGTRSPGKI